VLHEEGGELPRPPEYSIVQNKDEFVVMKQIQISVTFLPAAGTFCGIFLFEMTHLFYRTID
jgi:hypothetical protein